MTTPNSSQIKNLATLTRLTPQARQHVVNEKSNIDASKKKTTFALTLNVNDLDLAKVWWSSSESENIQRSRRRQSEPSHKRELLARQHYAEFHPTMVFLFDVKDFEWQRTQGILLFEIPFSLVSSSPAVNSPISFLTDRNSFDDVLTTKQRPTCKASKSSDQTSVGKVLIIIAIAKTSDSVRKNDRFSTRARIIYSTNNWRFTVSCARIRLASRTVLFIWRMR